MKSTVLSRQSAAHDIARAGANVRFMNDQLFFVKRCAPIDDLVAWVENDIKLRNAWQVAGDNLRCCGTNPTTWDTGDPDTLARLVEMYHDYPTPAYLGHYTTEV